MKTIDQIRNEPASFGGGPGEIIADTALHKGPYWCLKALGGDVLIASLTLPTHWGGGAKTNLTISDGDSLILAGLRDVTLTSGTCVAYKEALTPPSSSYGS